MNDLMAMRRSPSKQPCPKCGEMRGSYNHYTEGWIVNPHPHFIIGQGYKQCPGGPVPKGRTK